MIHVFHLLTLMFIFYELMWIHKSHKMTEQSLELQSYINDKNLSVSDWPDHVKSKIIKKVIIGFVTFVWLFGGLMTFNWLGFLFMIGFQLIIIMPLARLFRNNFGRYKNLHFVNSIIGFMFAIFMILNEYHLRIDLAGALF